METLVSYLTHFRLIDLLDILVVAFIIYRFLLVLQGTRAAQILLGILALALLWALSAIYELYALSWLLNFIFDYLFILVIVLFQEQIRSILVSLSSTKFLSRTNKDYFDQQIEEVVDAALALSREKTGALIVFEKNHGLLNYSMTGTRLNAKVHSDVIYSLFQTKSPLHDGAIIIYNGEIQSAGCLLPLSKNVDIDRHFGTRHRAALGITEVSDAVVVAVSEETGKINICYAGRFHLMDHEDHLRKTLRKFLLEIHKTKESESSSFSGANA